MAEVIIGERCVTIVNELGLHTRAASKFVRLASGYESEVTVEKDGQEVNGKSIMGVLMLVAAKGSEILIRTRGADAEAAADALARLVQDGFGEE
jgi:phosphocarrier protein HPr